MPAPSTPPSATRLRIAFNALHWVGWTFEAALHDPVRRDIIEFVATEWPKKTMDNIVAIHRIERLASHAAHYGGTACDANPYPAHCAAGQLFARCFDAEQERLEAQAVRSQAATETIATPTNI